MSLDLSRLEKVRYVGSKVRCRCPACAEGGGDKTGVHLSIEDAGDGAYHCIVDSEGKGGSHSKRIWELAGNPSRPGQYRPLLPIWRSRPVTVSSRIPDLRKPTVTELATIAERRGWPSFAGLEVLTQRKLLWYGLVFDNGVHRPAWIITDDTRKNADARRLDGGLWTFKDGRQGKAKALVSGARGWPIGASQIGACPVVLLCEGQPDFCAAPLVAFFEDVCLKAIAFVCVTGVGNDIHPDARPCFAGKHVRIAVHNDDAGRNAADRWARQLLGVGAVKVDGVDFSGVVTLEGKGVGDLADFARILDDENPPTERLFQGITSLP